MKRALYILLFLLVQAEAGAQNLVPNSNFESYSGCSSDWLYINTANGWNGLESSDYYNACITPSGTSTTDVPDNWIGYQYARSGQAYGGFYCVVPVDYREYIQTILLQPLQAGYSYCVSLYANLADTSRYAIKKIGAYFSVDTIIHPFTITTTPPDFYTFYYYTPQIESNNYLTDTVNWMNIEGVFIASGNEKYMTIGNFRDDAGTDTLMVNPDAGVPLSYYHIDDVSVEIVKNADAGADQWFLPGDSVQIGNNPTENATYSWAPSTGLSDPNAPNPLASPTDTTTYILTKTQCSVTTYDTVTVFISGIGIQDYNNNGVVTIYPNPCESILTIKTELRGTTILEINDVLGQLVYRERILPNGDKMELNIASLSPGLYILNLFNGKEKNLARFVKN